MKKLLVLVAGGIGYVLGTKAGRERYEQIRGTFKKVKDDPRVQEKAQHAADLAREKAPVVKEKVTEAANTATAKVRSANSSNPADQLNPESTVFQDNSGPRGDLP
ncbi:MAG: YtxH protein [Marmoricola sp.]|jgi:hypothetical protein|nr:YtxH protein [Marmoricola sp.]